MNKSQLVDALAERLGDRRAAATAVDGLLETIMSTVGAGESVSLTGFGVFESRARAARLARNPRTGESVEVAATTVPAFRPGTGFRSAVGGTSAPAPRSARPAATPAPPEVAEPVAEPVAESPKSGKAGKKAAKAASFAGDARPAKPKKGKVKSDATSGGGRNGGGKNGGGKNGGGKNGGGKNGGGKNGGGKDGKGGKAKSKK